jgi:ankyrin repeat protein
MESLGFEQIDARRMTIKSALANTCKWLLRRPEYIEWLDPDEAEKHHNILWIKGKPGAGKSTLMKYILGTSKRRMRGNVILNFFFNARGGDLEKSTIGMYRSLLLQLLERIPSLQSTFDSLELATRDTGCPQWTVESLKALFELAVQNLGQTPVLCLIDALDECDEGQIRDMLSFFERVCDVAISSRLEFRVCFSSRHYPHITIRHGLHLVLEGQEGHTQDIANYLETELRIGHSKLAEEIREDLQKKASGIFIWVVLVVEILNKEFDSGRPQALRRRIQEIPPDLHELFHDILTRDGQGKDELLLCIQWILFARRPLTPTELYFAILSAGEPDDLKSWDRDLITSQIMEKFILSSSKGLAEITKSTIPTVQFIHESVIDYLLKGNGLGKIWPELGENFRGISHEELKQRCLGYIRTCAPQLPVNLDQPLPKATSDEAAALRQTVAEDSPFMEYAVANVMYHSDSAEGDGISQNEFLSTFQLPLWIQFNNLFEKHTSRRHRLDASILYILAVQNLANLITIHPDVLSCLDLSEDRYGCPLFAAAATGSDQALQVCAIALATETRWLGGSHLEQTFRINLTRGFYFKETISTHIARYGNDRTVSLLLSIGRLGLDDADVAGSMAIAAMRARNFKAVNILLENGANIEVGDTRGKTLLTYAVMVESEEMVRLLLNKGANMESKCNIGRTPLTYAARDGNEASVRLLLEKGANIESRCISGRSVLSYATEGESTAIIRLLLEKGADIESRSVSGRPVLSYAAQEDTATVKLLLEKGADIGSRCASGRSALSFAAVVGSTATIRLLLENGADIGSRCASGRTPLAYAVVGRNTATIRLLLENGADIESRCVSGRTPLSYAAVVGSQATIRLLLENGADVESKCTAGWTPLSYAASLILRDRDIESLLTTRAYVET